MSHLSEYVSMVKDKALAALLVESHVATTGLQQ